MNRDRRKLLIAGSAAGAFALTALLARSCVKRHPQTSDEVRAPQRPGGQPKPLIEEDIGPMLQRLDAWYAAHLSDRYKFNPPATDVQIDEFQRLVGITLPRSYRQLYRWHDGENDDRRGHIFGLPIVSLSVAASEWLAWNRVLVDLKGDRYAIPGRSWPPGAVDPAYINPRRIPLTIDGSGNSIGVDFDPWPAGRMGQVILCGRDEDVKTVLAPSLGAFLGWIADLLEGGNFRLGPELGHTMLREFRLKTPPVDYFADGARRLLGAPSD
jgi:cell wall assembly regulator SMI1